MKSKALILIISLLVTFNVNLNASEQIPKWINISYSDLEQHAVSEYQVVTITVKENHSLFKSANSTIDIKYNPQQLQLANVAYTTSKQERMRLDDTKVSSDESQFSVKYQFYLKPNIDIESTPITITKSVGKQTKSVDLELRTHSYTSGEILTVDDIKLKYKVLQYQNDQTNINYIAQFDVLANPQAKKMQLALQKNNMEVSNQEEYNVQVFLNDQLVSPINNNQVEVEPMLGDVITLEINAKVSALSSKNNRFEFLIYVASGTDFIRLEPTFFISELTKSGANLNVKRYRLIKMFVNVFFVILVISYIIIIYCRKKVIK